MYTGWPREASRSAMTGSENDRSLEPGGVDLFEAAVFHSDMQPLVDEVLQRAVALQPIGFLGEVERLVGMHRAQHAPMQLLLIARLRGIGDHEVGITLGDLVENGDIVAMNGDLGVLDVGAREALIGA